VDALGISVNIRLDTWGKRRIHGVDLVWYRSSLTSTDRLRYPGHMSRPLSILSNAFSTAK
jgi:hypothetical protein